MQINKLNPTKGRQIDLVKRGQEKKKSGAILKTSGGAWEAERNHYFGGEDSGFSGRVFHILLLKKGTREKRYGNHLFLRESQFSALEKK